MTNKPHILFIVPGFPKSAEDSWVVTYFTNYLKGFQETYPEVLLTIIALDYPYLRRRYMWNGIEVHSLSGSNNKLLKPLKWVRALSLAYCLHRKNKITCIHTLWLREATFIGYYLSRIIRVPIISTAMGTELNGKNLYLKFINFKKIKLCAVSKLMQTLITKRIGVSSDIVSWGIPNCYAHNNKSGVREFDLLFVGFFNQVKNLQMFIEICIELKREFPRLKAQIIGKDFSDGKWKKLLTNQPNIQENIQFMGLVPNERVLSIMQRSKILVHTSTFESLGYAMLEAQACGMTVISHQVGVADEGDLWRIAESKSEFIEIIKEELKSKRNNMPIISIPMKNTIIRYTTLYGVGS